MTPTQKERYNKLGESVVKALNARHFEACYCPDIQSAAEKLLSLIPETDTVAWGGSQTLAEIGAQDKLRARGQALIDRDTAKSPVERDALMRAALLAGAPDNVTVIGAVSNDTDREIRRGKDV